MDRDTVRKYFEENARSWVEDGYKDDGYNYPVGYHRTRITIKVLSELNKPIRVVDLGCGRGDLTLALAERGHTVIGIDQSTEMINMAENARMKLLPEVQEHVRFICRPLEVNKLDKNSFDAVTAMGVMYYLPTDDIFFNIANQLLKPGGLFLVSCRNRLFNMVSITYRTIKEIESGNALSLISEIEELYKTVSPEDTDVLIREFKKIIKELPDKTSYNDNMLSPSEKYGQNPYTVYIEPRQHTPKGLLEVAKKFDFEHKSYYGVHPHIIAPRMNRLLPPKVFNKLSGCLEVLEHLPVSLCWSSHFIGVFKKRNRRKQRGK